MIIRASLLSLVFLVPVAALGATCTTATKGNATGHFYVQNGQIIAPDGTPFLARGVNDGQIADNAQALIDTFPGLNFVRVPIGPGSDPASFAAAVDLLSSRGIVVEFEDHSSSDGQNRGGGTGTIFTGQQLQDEMAMYSSFASYYKFNPLIWFGTDNEPSTINPATGKSDPAALSDWQLQTYNAIRQAGNNNPIMLEINGWGDPNSFAAGYNLADYTGMTNVIGDVHDYGWVTDYSTDQAVNDNFLSEAVASLQSRLITADGPIAALVGEYGNSTTGEAIDANGSQVVTAVNTSGLGSVAWYFNQGYPGDGLLNGDGTLSAYGQQVAAYIAAGGCPAQPATKDQLVSEITPDLPPLQELPAEPVIPAAPPNPIQYPGQPQIPGVVPPVVTLNTPVANDNLPAVNVAPPDVPKYQVGVPNFTIPVIEPLIPPPEADPAIKTLTAVVNKGMTMLASPIGTWLLKMDGSIVGGMDVALQGLAPALTAPVSSMCLLFLGARGVRIAQGDSNAMHNLWYNFIKIMIVVGLSTNLGNFNYYVRSLFYTNLPNFLTKAVGGQLVTDGLHGTASVFDSIWAQTWVLIGKVYQQAGVFDFGSRLSAEFCGITIGAALMAMALVYLLARILLGIVIVLGPVCISCTLFEQSKPIFERWMGKVIALTCLQLAGVILLTMLFAADKEFMAQIVPAATAVGAELGASGAPAPTIASDIENLVAMVIWFGMGAFAMYALPAIAYSIGTGIATSLAPLALGLFGAAKAISSGVSGLLGAAGAAGEAMGEMSMSFARDELTMGSGGMSLPPPPPPALSYATAPAFGD